MAPYFILYAASGLAALVSIYRPLPPLVSRYWWALLWIVLVFFIGYRYGIGGDWLPYIKIFNDLSVSSVSDFITDRHPAYSIIAWSVSKIGLGIITVNVILAVIYFTGLFRFAKHEPYPLLTISLALPFLVYVTSTGFVRQTTAYMIALFALTFLVKDNRKWFFISMIPAIFMHYSSVFFLIIYFFANIRNIKSKYFVIGLITTIVLMFVFSHIIMFFLERYIDNPRQQLGAAPRAWLNVFPALITILAFERLFPDRKQAKIWSSILKINAYLALIFCFLVYLIPTQTVQLDRMGCYITILQLAIWPRFLLLFPKPSIRVLIAFFILLCYGLGLYWWFETVFFVEHWVPYQNYWFMNEVATQ